MHAGAAVALVLYSALEMAWFRGGPESIWAATVSGILVSGALCFYRREWPRRIARIAVESCTAGVLHAILHAVLLEFVVNQPWSSFDGLLFTLAYLAAYAFEPVAAAICFFVAGIILHYLASR